MPDGRHVGKYWKCYNTPTDGLIGTKLGWLHPTNTSTAKPFPWYLVVTANRTVNVLALWDVEIRNIHNFDETWMTVCHCVAKKIKSSRKQQILIKKTQKFYYY